MKNKKIMIGNDHGGFDLKISLVKHLKEKGYEIIDAGSNSGEIVRYPYYASMISNAVSSKEVPRGILICSTGIGMSIIANKYKDVRAALCSTTYQGKMTYVWEDAVLEFLKRLTLSMPGWKQNTREDAMIYL